MTSKNVIFSGIIEFSILFCIRRQVMKKLLVLLLVLGVTSLANAGVIDVVTVGVGDQGHAGTSQDPLVASETIEIAILMNYNTYPDRQFPSYDGYFTDSVGLDLHVSGPGTLSVPGIFDKNQDRIGDDLMHHSEFGAWSQSGINDGTPGGYVPMVVDNGIAKMAGGVLTGGIRYDEDGGGGAGVLIWNLFLHCDGFGEVLVDLTIQDPASRYSPYWKPSTDAPYPEWQALLASDLGDLTIYQVPEPMTICLLGIGGFFLRRRRK
jgi:hypothetical protein